MKQWLFNQLSKTSKHNSIKVTMLQSLMADGTKSINCLTSPCVKTKFVIFGFNAKLKKIKKEEKTTGKFFS